MGVVNRGDDRGAAARDHAAAAVEQPGTRRPVRISIAGGGNGARSLVQGIAHYRNVPPDQQEAWGVMHLDMGGYRPGDVEVVAAFDVDARKVGRPLHEAAFAPPSCT